MFNRARQPYREVSALAGRDRDGELLLSPFTRTWTSCSPTRAAPDEPKSLTTHSFKPLLKRAGLPRRACVISGNACATPLSESIHLKMVQEPCRVLHHSHPLGDLLPTSSPTSRPRLYRQS